MVNGQVDCLVLGGLMFFNGVDPLILLMKPQVAAGAIVSRVKRTGRQWSRYVLPSLVGLGISLVVWWMWPVAFLGPVMRQIPGYWNSSLWPFGIPFGLFSLWKAWKTADERWGVVASPLLSPYVNLPSYLGLLAVIVSRWPRWTVVVLIAVYGLFAFGLLTGNSFP